MTHTNIMNRFHLPLCKMQGFHQCIHLREQRNSLALHLAEYTNNARVAVFADISAYTYVNNNAVKVNTNIKLLCEQ